MNKYRKARGKNEWRTTALVPRCDRTYPSTNAGNRGTWPSRPRYTKSTTEELKEENRRRPKLLENKNGDRVQVVAAAGE
jgi:hypothetical protein